MLHRISKQIAHIVDIIITDKFILSWVKIFWSLISLMQFKCYHWLRNEHWQEFIVGIFNHNSVQSDSWINKRIVLQKCAHGITLRWFFCPVLWNVRSYFNLNEQRLLMEKALESFSVLQKISLCAVLCIWLSITSYGVIIINGKEAQKKGRKIA